MRLDVPLQALIGLTLLGVARAQTPPAVPEPSGTSVGGPLRNVLILVADDLGVDMLSCYGVGSAPPPTPHLERMASEGVLFRNAWALPTCSPTRATIQTGRFPFRNSIGCVISTYSGGPGLPLDELTLPEMLDQGTGGRYAHAAIGKWHLGTSQVGDQLAPNLAGYGYFAGSLQGQLAAYDSWTRVVNGVGAHESRYATSVAVDDALAWIGAQTRPWLCYVAFQAPHAPFHRPPPALHTRSLPFLDPAPWCGASGGDPRPFYDAMVEALDTEIGRLLAGLSPLERARTTVIFLGDNGSDSCLIRPPLPSSHCKSTLYEGGLRVPLIVSGAGVTRPGVSTALVESSDLFATVAEIAGVDLAARFPGRRFDSVSLLPSVADPARRGERLWLYAENYTPNGRGNPQPLPPCPTQTLCQADLGYGGPGPARLDACGPPLYGLYGSNLVPLQLSAARPGARALLSIGPLAPAFDPRLGGWLVSSPPAALVPFVVNASGRIDTAFWNGPSSHEAHYQFVIEDPRQVAGFELSNAVRLDLLWTDMQAARDWRFKLIRLTPCREELYDLLLDPDESEDLLQAPLSPDARAHRASLSFVLDHVR